MIPRHRKNDHAASAMTQINNFLFNGVEKSCAYSYFDFYFPVGPSRNDSRTRPGALKNSPSAILGRVNEAQNHCCFVLRRILQYFYPIVDIALIGIPF